MATTKGTRNRRSTKTTAVTDDATSIVVEDADAATVADADGTATVADDVDDTDKNASTCDEPVTTQVEQKIVVKEIDSNQRVVVRNGVQGRLVYRSSHTGERWEWDVFGAEQEMELSELKNAKNSPRSKNFFVKNWWLFDEDWVIDYLGVGMYYKNALKVDEFDDIFSLSATKLKKRISELSDGQKKTVAYRARKLINEGQIDSLTTIKALEKALDIELIEK